MRTFKGILLILIILTDSVRCFSQENKQLSDSAWSANLKISYNSSLIYPGARVGFEFPLKSVGITKTRPSGRVLSFKRDLYFLTNMSWYHHPRFHDNFYLTGGLMFRKTSARGFFTGFSPELGYSQTFLGGTTYSVDHNGQVSILKSAGYHYAFLSVGEGVGFDFSRISTWPVMVYYQFNLFALYPYNNTLYFRPAMEAGCIIKLRGNPPGPAKGKGGRIE